MPLAYATSPFQLARRNKLSVPWGRMPRLDWSHPAVNAAPYDPYSPGNGAVLVADAKQGTMRDLVSQTSAVPGVGTINGSVSPIGPLATPAAGANYMVFPTASFVNVPFGLTIAAIGIMPAAGATAATVVQSLSGATGLFLQSTGGYGAFFLGENSNFFNTILLSGSTFSWAGKPFFLLFSASFTTIESAGLYEGNAVLYVKNLWTGQTWSLAPTLQDTADWGPQMQIGGAGTNACALAALSVTYTALNKDRCAQWLNDPWGLWYAEPDIDYVKSAAAASNPPWGRYVYM